MTIFTRSQFICAVFSTSALLFLVTGIQYWISDYLLETIGVPQAEVFISFALISVTAPLAGVLVGGYITQSLGGYATKSALIFSVWMGAVGSVVAVIVPFLDNFVYIAAGLWILFFIGGALLPNLTGIMISSIPRNMRNMGSAVAQFIEHLCGYLPAPAIYGILNDSEEEKQERLGMKVLMSSTVVGVLFMGIALYLRTKRTPKTIFTDIQPTVPIPSHTEMIELKERMASDVSKGSAKSDGFHQGLISPIAKPRDIKEAIDLESASQPMLRPHFSDWEGIEQEPLPEIPERKGKGIRNAMGMKSNNLYF